MGAFGRAVLLSGAAGIGLSVADPAIAQEGGSSAEAREEAGPVNRDEPIVVLGARLEESQPEQIERYGSRLEEISGEQIDRAGFVDTGQALQMLVPGLYVAPKSGAFDYVNVSLLGSRTKDLLFLVDGVRISNRLYASTTPLDTIPANMIERIEMLKGGQGLYYGTQAVSGVINVVTKAFTGETDGAVEAGYDTNEGYHLNGYVRDGFGGCDVVADRGHLAALPARRVDGSAAVAMEPPASDDRSGIWSRRRRA